MNQDEKDSVPLEPIPPPENVTGWRGFLNRSRQQIIGFFGWYLIAAVLASFFLGPGLFMLTLIALLVFSLIKETRGVAGGILLALALNFVISLFLGMVFNAICFIPFFYQSF